MMTISKKKAERLKELFKDVPAIRIEAQPVHGSHAAKKKTTIINEATEKMSLRDFNNKHQKDVSDNHADLSKHYYKHNDTNSNLDIVNFTGTSHKVNHHLIDPSRYEEAKNTLNERIKNIDSYVNTAPALHKDIDVYHGLAGWHPGMESYKHPERHVQLPAYTSTSIDPKTAHGFCSPASSTKVIGSKHMLRIKLKKGQTPGSYVSPISQHEDEKEFILRRNSKLKIERKPEIIEHKSDYTKSGKTHTYVWTAHYVPEEDPS